MAPQADPSCCVKWALSCMKLPAEVPRDPQCKPGFIDRTRGRAYLWACGRDRCPGSYVGWTDGCCNCACVAASEGPATCGEAEVAAPATTVAPLPVAASPALPISHSTQASTNTVRNELKNPNFIPKSNGESSVTSQTPKEESSGVPVGLIAIVVGLALCIAFVFFCILVLFQGCPGFDCSHMTTRKKISRVQPLSDPVVHTASPQRGSWMSQDAYPQVPQLKIDKNAEKEMECDTSTTYSPTPRSVVTATISDASSWRSPRSCPRRLSVESHESYGAVHCAVQKQYSESSRRGSLLTPDTHSNSVRSQSAAPQANRTSMDSQSQEHRRARSSSPRPSLRTTASVDQQSDHRGRSSSRSVSPRPLQ